MSSEPRCVVTFQPGFEALAERDLAAAHARALETLEPGVWLVRGRLAFDSAIALRHAHPAAVDVLLDAQAGLADIVAAVASLPLEPHLPWAVQTRAIGDGRLPFKPHDVNDAVAAAKSSPALGPPSSSSVAAPPTALGPPSSSSVAAPPTALGPPSSSSVAAPPTALGPPSSSSVAAPPTALGPPSSSSVAAPPTALGPPSSSSVAAPPTALGPPSSSSVAAPPTALGPPSSSSAAAPPTALGPPSSSSAAAPPTALGPPSSSSAAAPPTALGPPSSSSAAAPIPPTAPPPYDRKSPAQVLSITLVGRRLLAGLSRTTDNLSAWPGGARRFAHGADATSRAAHKLEEALEVFALTPRGRALDLGAAPGGWTRVLAERGLAVTAVDPAALDRAVLALPGIDHQRVTAERFLASAPAAPYDLIVNDMRLDARDAARLLCDYARHLSPRGHLLTTLKLPERGYLPVLDQAFDLLGRRYRRVAARQLFHNRSEVTVLLTPL